MHLGSSPTNLALATRAMFVRHVPSCILHITRHVALRYALAQFVANLALAAQFNCLETVGADEPTLAQLRAWAKEVRRARGCASACVCLHVCARERARACLHGWVRACVMRAFLFPECHSAAIP